MIFLRHYSYSPPVDCRSFGVELAEEVFVAPLDHLLVEEFVLFSCLLPVLELLALEHIASVPVVLRQDVLHELFALRVYKFVKIHQNRL